MTNSGDAAEQIVRMSLEGTEVALKLSGSAAKNIAAALYTIAKNADRNKTKGHQRLSAMLKSGKELKVFTISEEHLKRFAQEAKRYGVVYCALRGKEKSADGMVDVMVRAEDASKINHTCTALSDYRCCRKITRCCIIIFLIDTCIVQMIDRSHLCALKMRASFLPDHNFFFVCLRRS